MSLFKRSSISILLFIGVVMTFTACSYQDPEVISFDGIEVLKMEEQKGQLELNFTLNNPNNRTIKLKTATFDISVNKVFLGTGILTKEVELPGNGQHQIQLLMDFELEKSIAEVATSLGFAVLTNNINLHVKGEAKGAIGFFSKTFQINHTEKIDWSDLQKMAI